ncbi:MAG: bifunctional phosphoribosyl-AMP cyclohydrolase/phosphoribosyl-ATP diphosphatase HisIE [Roseiflexus sp.]|jgi:phosphoribosyl-ATP pyrophosphohydrolase/phosphoribosyl-AMP cyclohydrolase|nr:bifunctional phosphoribosyl-AMP cyclohydrolase/phosphoribosyl-ATP diphosphatase HisIE [Roseiflexus sp.]MBO9333926.1 bifunctional phosphoribosyl-AMP cyclohydrolase/phosphoribosyl-ATP diphosphatase HisIE [Roseiflexus sp.]MBO9364471.1 bifunctional phosphoribosyl-AMP cyclohydrolase/phosphoribosyl-ATP diphosphatase HisIE [Roseiflexus sp.]MBO9381082.1 bifunctional phosphoribosyl-AMP cyclohydrolase/phosphoribosyl-ATP diphosphatase HisIE [Roseiflexus sp.]MBO9387442.1 bifunctional phosphoribosyl-AMP 
MTGNGIKFDASGLIPAIVQHARSGEVLMLGYMNEEALQQTLVSGMVTFWSRSRQALWRKGETSGNVLRLIEIRQDCDGDALLVLAEPAGPTCHTGRVSCFHRTLEGDVTPVRMPQSVILTDLANVIAQRASAPKEGSYTAKMLAGGVDRIGKKIGEEAAEVIIAAKNGAPDEVAWEIADLMYHTLVLLQQQGMTIEAVWDELRRRYGG